MTSILGREMTGTLRHQKSQGIVNDHNSSSSTKPLPHCQQNPFSQILVRPMESLSMISDLIAGRAGEMSAHSRLRTATPKKKKKVRPLCFTFCCRVYLPYISCSFFNTKADTLQVSPQKHDPVRILCDITADNSCI